jgi:hypothetical protein
VIDESWSQAHALTLADLDGDGHMDFVTGKRYMAHNGKDPGEREPLGVYWYRWGLAADGKRVEFSRHIVDYGSRAGGGMQICVADLDGDGDLDLVTPGKSGSFCSKTSPARPTALILSRRLPLRKTRGWRPPCPGDVLLAVSRRNEGRLELRGREADAALEQPGGGSARSGRCRIGAPRRNRSPAGREKERDHRAGAVHRDAGRRGRSQARCALLQLRGTSPGCCFRGATWPGRRPPPPDCRSAFRPGTPVPQERSGFMISARPP